MANGKSKRKLAVGLFFILVIAIVAFVYVGAMVTSGGSTGTGNHDPGSSNDTPVGSLGSDSSGLIWQSLYVTNKDGTSYWANAPEQFNLLAILGSPSGSGEDFTEIQSMQNNIYMNIAQPCSTWSFSCQETITVTDQSGNILATIADASSVNANGQSVPAGENVWVTGASVSGEQLQQIINLGAGNYYFTISLANINLTLDGQNLSAQSASDANTLAWLIQVQ